PFSGLDPVNAQLIEKEIFNMKEEGTTIIFSTHRMEQVEELCDHIALMSKGQLMLENDIQEVRKQFQKNVYRVEYKGDRSFWERMNKVDVLELTDKFAMLKASESITGKDIMQILINSPLEIFSFELHLPRLREIFIELVGKKNIHSKPLKSI
ncbi:MAG: DUF4162 domain-containing protein, partial [Bacteroidetes bacterium]|nr:DUF4162 domain-containing protein [Bacteroidota bacterium]